MVWGGGHVDVVQDVFHFALGNLTPYRALDEIAHLRGLFDPRAALGAEMENELTAVRTRKEVLTEPRHKEKRRNAGQKKGGDEKGASMDERCEQGGIGVPKPFEYALERPLEPHQRISRTVRIVLLCFAQLHVQGGHKRAGHDV